MKKYAILLLPVLVLFFALSINSYAESKPKPAKKKVVYQNPLPIVGTQEKLKSLLKEGNKFRRNYFNGTLKDGANFDTSKAEKSTGNGPTGGSDDHSTTNVQVEGVDEADTVKTDGRYIYNVNNQQVIITRANPAEKLAVVKTLKYKAEEFSPFEIYVDKEHLVVIGSTYYPMAIDTKEAEKGKKMAADDMRILPQPMGKQTVKAIIYDITAIDNIKEVREMEVEGGYISSRKIGSSLYLIANKYIDYSYIAEPGLYKKGVAKDTKADSKSEDIPTPVYREGKGDFCTLSLKDIRYFPKTTEPNYLLIAGLDLKSPQEKLKITAYLGSGQTIYSTKDNLYVAVSQFENITKTENKKINTKNPKKLMADDFKTNTVIYKFGLKEGTTSYLAEGKVPGNILNQFSMDEFAGNFRIATTNGDTWRTDENTSKNNIYVLDSNLKTVGKLENLAPGERIYSVRFMGKRGYLVTFKQVDPLFVIDLENPKSPKVLGALKIPGYSNYLHPYDENHILGFGKDTIEVETDSSMGPKGKIALYQGMKVALFDVTDVANPKEKFKAEIGDRGTDSELLYNHKVLLFNRAKNLLAFPVTVTKIKESPSSEYGKGFEYGVPVFQGAYVYNLDLDKGFVLKGKITHLAEGAINSGKPEAFDWNKHIQRILYIGDNLYTLSQDMIKVNNLIDLKEVSSIELK